MAESNDKINDNENKKIEEENQDTVVSMVDILQQEEALEEEYVAVLGGSDEKFCTYSKGYITRQALYSCMTCSPDMKTDPTKRSCICLACSYNCHENHELIELYTKRNFRCDCGNSKMPNVKCNLEPIKDEINELNSYNQNFSGVYCTCHRPYPDPEDSIEDTMLQCCVCEDWYHGRHLESILPTNFDEMICGDCVQKNEFLKNYSDLMILNNKNETSDVDVLNNDSEPDNKKIKIDENVCVKPKEVTGNYEKGAVFWMDGWRTKLCRCKDCFEMYKELKIEFLLNTDDTVKVYEEKGKSGHTSSYERGMKALSSLERTAQVDAITAYNKMKEKLKDYLKDFVNNRQVVTEEDINRFFGMMKKEENNQSVPHFCR